MNKYPQKSYTLNYFHPQNRRYLGNKYKLLGFIEKVLKAKCGKFNSFCDIFAGTGTVGQYFNKKDIQIISNDFLESNYVSLKTFLESNVEVDVSDKLGYLNSLKPKEDNYFSVNFGNSYFSNNNAKKIGIIREEINNVSANKTEKNILISSLLYAVDRVANTVGHYDAFRRKLDNLQPIVLAVPFIDYSKNKKNTVFKEDSNKLLRRIYSDILYIDPPYNSRQYSDTYHLLENLAEWKKPKVFGVAKKMDRKHIKSAYCLKNANVAFEDLIREANCKHILLSYNSTGESRHGRSNARINDLDIKKILEEKGSVEIFEKKYRIFTAGKNAFKNNKERIFYCKVKRK